MSQPRLVTALLVLGAGCSTTVAQDLPSPFSRPSAARTDASPPSDAAQPREPGDFDLRATLVRGRDSSANIGGRILRVGERIGNYKLASVHEGAAVVVDAAGVSYVLEIEPPRQVPP